MTTLRPPAIATFATHGLSQAPHLMKHLIRFRAPKAENEALADIRRPRKRRKGATAKDLPARRGPKSSGRTILAEA